MITLLDCSLPQDAAACGADREMEGLKIVFENHRDVGPCLYVTKYGHSIEFVGNAEIGELIRAAQTALRRCAVDASAMAAE